MNVRLKIPASVGRNQDMAVTICERLESLEYPEWTLAPVAKHISPRASSLSPLLRELCTHVSFRPLKLYWFSARQRSPSSPPLTVRSCSLRCSWTFLPRKILSDKKRSWIRVRIQDNDCDDWLDEGSWRGRRVPWKWRHKLWWYAIIFHSTLGRCSEQETSFVCGFGDNIYERWLGRRNDEYKRGETTTHSWEMTRASQSDLRTSWLGNSWQRSVKGFAPHHAIGPAPLNVSIAIIAKLI